MHWSTLMGQQSGFGPEATDATVLIKRKSLH